LRVLFVSSGNNGISPIIRAQGKSLEKAGINILYYGVKGRGAIGYLSNIARIKHTIRSFKPDLVHAHYSDSAILASLSTRRKIVASLMGSDVMSSGLWRLVIRFFVKHVWAFTIVKSEDMKSSLGVHSDKIHVIPNGVDLDVFKPLDKNCCRARLRWEISKKIVLFAANPNRPEKNFDLAKKSFELAGLKNAELKVVFNIKHEEIPYYLCASDLLLSTSKWEGSPNII